MGDENTNHIASSDDFRSAAYEQAFEPEERVVLPESGLPVVLRRPRLIFFTLTKHPYPAEVAEKIASAAVPLSTSNAAAEGKAQHHMVLDEAVETARPFDRLRAVSEAPHRTVQGEVEPRGVSSTGTPWRAPTNEELKAYADWVVEVLGAVFVKPRLALAPGPDEIHPNWLRPGDVQFIFQWMTGGIVGAIRESPESFRSADAGGGAGGRDVLLPAERDPARVDRRVEN